MGRIIFGTISNRTRPVGGIKVIYQAVACLRRCGFDAYVSDEPELPPWLVGSPSVEGVAFVDVNKRLELEPDDVFVAHDAMAANHEALLLKVPERRVMFVQNHNALRVNTAVDWPRLRRVRCLTVSEYSKRYLVEEAGFDDVTVIPPGVDLDVFRPAGQKHPRIAFMPRKWPGFAKALASRLDRRLNWLPIDGCSEAETAELLGGSTIFLNLGRTEGFGLPPLEAMAAGCIVCGFSGEGTTDFATDSNGYWAPEGDLDACAEAVRRAIAVFADRDALKARWRAGMGTARSYAMPVFEQRIVDYFEALL